MEETGPYLLSYYPKQSHHSKRSYLEHYIDSFLKHYIKNHFHPTHYWCALVPPTFSPIGLSYPIGWITNVLNTING